MADFIAVIRRAVDGLSDNTPEMRIKVYDRARSAVQRQLDNMKPRPADEVIARQMDKLDEAIATIEREFSGAPAEPEPEIAPPEPAEEPPPPPARYEAPVREDDRPAVAEPVSAAPEPEREPEPEPETEPEPAHSEAADHEPEQLVEHEDEHDHAVPAVEPEPESEPGLDDDTMPPSEPEPRETAWYREPVAPPSPPERAPVTTPFWDRSHRDEAEDNRGRQAPGRTEAPLPQWEPDVSDNPFQEPTEIFAPQAEHQPAEQQNDPFGGSLAHETAKPEERESKSWWDEIPPPVSRTPATQPAATPATSWDSFESFVGERSEPQVDADALKPLRGRDGMSVGRAEPPKEPPRELPGKPVPRERDGKGKLIVALVVALVVLVGAGYAGWRFSDTILAFVNGGSASSTQTASKSTTSTDNKTPAATTPANQQASANAAKGPDKFTQRLLPNGTEVDSGTQGEAVASATQAEGKSVAAQNEKPAAAAPATTPPATGQSQPAADTAQTAAEPVKMFLYEERLGQAQPTALQGTVSWSVKTDNQDGHNEKIIQGDISVPGRKMSAIFTLRRNNDPTLPASHIIELTFSLPKDFEGRGIESVLRISMKNKEQDQGDALIAVPAKITDYFHMIALNSFADAVKTNLELLKTRDWIDIPLVYSNGRRALLTLQKGPEGEKVFNEVLASWQATASDIPIPSPPPAEPNATPAPGQ